MAIQNIEGKSDINVGVVAWGDLTAELRVLLSRHSALRHPGVDFLELSEEISAADINTFLADKHIGILAGSGQNAKATLSELSLMDWVSQPHRLLCAISDAPIPALPETGFPQVITQTVTGDNRDQIVSLQEAAILSWVAPLIQRQIVCIDLADARTVFGNMLNARVLLLQQLEEMARYGAQLASAQRVWCMLSGAPDALSLALFEKTCTAIEQWITDQATLVVGTIWDEGRDIEDMRIVMTILTSMDNEP